MLKNQLFIQVLHPFILYAIFGTLIGYMLVKSAIFLWGIKDPKRKITLLFLPMFVPFFTLAIRMFTGSKCLFETNTSIKIINTVYHAICNGGTILASILLPLSLLAIILATVKGIGSIVACRRLVSKYGFAGQENYPELIILLEKVAAQADIAPPNLLITNQQVARSFTFGFKKPVIVISQGILAYLDMDELETVLAHEVAHVLRGDAMLNWITVFLRDFMFFAPAIYYVFRDIIEEKEKASDDIALELTDKHLAFGQALIKVWRLSPKTLLSNLALDNFSAQPNFIRHNGILEARLHRIVDPDKVREFNPMMIIFLFSTIIFTVLSILYILC